MKILALSKGSETVAITGNTNSNTTVNSLTSDVRTSLYKGMIVTGAGIAADTIIASVDSDVAITLSRAATATASVELTFSKVNYDVPTNPHFVTVNGGNDTNVNVSASRLLTLIQPDFEWNPASNVNTFTAMGGFNLTGCSYTSGLKVITTTGDTDDLYIGCSVDTTWIPATATITVADGDAVSGMTENEKVIIKSTDGTVKNYIIVDDQLSSVATGDVVTSGVTDVGSTTATATGVAVTIDLTGTPVTQNAFLVELKAAIEHSNGHNGKITVSSVPTEANGAQLITLTQATVGLAGDNVTTTTDISQATIVGFNGGVGGDIPDNTVVTEILSGTTFGISNAVTASGSSITLVCGMEHSNLANTKGFRIKCFDDTIQKGVQLSGGDFNLATHYYFVLVYSDDYLQHHVARITEFINEDVTGDAFEFEPRLGNEIPKDTKFQIWRLEIPTTNHPVAVSVGLKTFSDGVNNELEDNIVCASPLFYFFNDYLDKNNELNHNTRYNVKHDMCLAFSNAFISTDQTPILTSQDYSNSIIDYSKYSLKVKMVDNLRTLDNPTTNNGSGTCNENLPLTAFNLDANNSCFPNSRRDATDYITTSHAAPQSDAAYRQITGPNRYLYYDFSPTKSNFTPNVFDAHIYESTGRRGSFAETKIVDTFRMMPKKLKTFTPYRARHRLYQSEFNDWMALGAKVKSNVTGNEYTFYTDFDLGTLFNVGDEVKVGSTILVVNTIDAFSSFQQDITFETYNRIDSESIFGTSSYTLSADDIIYRRAWNNTDGTLLTDFNFVDSRFTNLYVKFISSDFGLLEASVTAANKDTKLLTLSFDSQSYTSTTALDYLSGSYIIEVERFSGEIEKIDSYKEHGQTIMELSGRSNFSKLISPILNKNARFSQDIIYSSNSPFQKIISLGVYVYGYFDSATVHFRTKNTTDTGGGADEAMQPVVGGEDYDPVAGDKIFFKYDDGTLCYAGEVSSYDDSAKTATLTQTSRAEAPTYFGRPTAYYVPANTKNYVFNKALNSNSFTDSASSLTGASGKGIFFESGYKLTSSGAEDTNLVGSSSVSVAGSVGYYISDTNQIKSEYAFQTRLDDNASSKTYSSFDTINTLIDFTILNVSKETNSTIVEVAPYLPLTLGRVDVNYANTQDTTFSTTTLGTLGVYSGGGSPQLGWANVSLTDGSEVLSSIADPRKYHGKPVYIGSTFQGFLRQAVLDNNHTTIKIFLDRAWDGTSTGEVNVLEYTDGANSATYSESSKLTHELNFLNGAHLHGGKIISLISPLIMEVDAVKSTATIIVADGDSTTVPTEKEYMTIKSTDDTEKKYVIVDDYLTSVATGDILSSGSDTGASTAGAGLAGGIAVAINISSSPVTQNAFLVQLKAAIEHANGHNGKITVSDVPTEANGPQLITLTQDTAGLGGNNTITDNISQTTLDGFTGGITSSLNNDRICAFDYPIHYKLSEESGVSPYSYTYSEKYGSPHYRIINMEKGQYNQTTHANTGTANAKDNKYYANISSKISYYASAYRFKTGYTVNSIGSSGTTEKVIVGVGKTGQTHHNTYQVAENHLLIESRGWKPAVGSRYFDNILNYNSGNGDKPEAVLFTPTLSADGATIEYSSPYGTIDKFDLIDPKIARMFLFANSDLIPYSSTRYDSLMYSGQTRDISRYNLFSLIEPVSTTDSETKSVSFGDSTTIVTKDSSYSSATIIKSDKTVNTLKRFSMMRLTELVFDWHFNQFDPENIPSKDAVLSKFEYRSYDLTATTCIAVLAANYSGDELTGVVVDPSSQFAVNDAITDSEGRFIGKYASTSGSGPYTITFAEDAYKTDGDAYYVGYLYKAPVLDVITNANQITGHGKQDTFVILDNEIHMLRSAVIREGANYGESGSSFHDEHSVILNHVDTHTDSKPNIFLPVIFSSSGTGNLETADTQDTNHPSMVLKMIDSFQTADDATTATIDSRGYKNLLPVFLDRFGIENGGGSRVSKGTAAPSTEGASIRDIGAFSLVGINLQADYSIYEGPSGGTRAYDNDADGVMMGFKLRIKINQAVPVIGGDTGTGTEKTVGGKTVYTYLIQPDSGVEFGHKALRFANDLTGCYLVSEKHRYIDADNDIALTGGTQDMARSINNGSPTDIVYIIAHDIDTTSVGTGGNGDRHHRITVDQQLNEEYYRVMQPNHTCFYEYTPTTIALNVMSSNYTKVSGESRTYVDGSINDYLMKEGTADKRVASVNNQGGSEAVLSMYVVADLDVQHTSSDTVVLRSQSNVDSLLSANTTYKMCVSDGDNVNKTNIEYIVDDDSSRAFRYLKFGSHKEMVGVPSISEIMNLTVNGDISIDAKRAMIGSVVTVCPESETLIDELLEENDINYTLTKNVNYPLFLAPNYQGIDLFSAANYLLEKKNKRLIDIGDSFAITDDDDDSHYSNIILSDSGDYQIHEYEKVTSMFDYYNDIIVYGRAHKSTKRDIKSIQKRGKKTLEVFENELLTQDEVDKRGITLLNLHSDDNQKLTLTVGHKGISQIRTGDKIGVEIIRENIPLRQYVVLQIEHMLTGNMKLELGRFSKKLEDRFAELALTNQRINTKIREQVFDENSISYDFLTDLNINEIRLLVRERTTSGFVLGFNTGLNTGTTALRVGEGAIITDLVEEEY